MFVTTLNTFMSAEGAVIIGVDNDERRLAMAMEAINMSGGRAIGRPTNALDEAQVNEAVAWAAKQYGTVDVLVNGALVWHGEVVVVDEEFGIRVSEIVVDEN